MASSKPIISLGADRHQQIVRTLAHAFQEDPALSWIFPDADARRARLPLMFDFIVPLDLRDGIALGADAGEAATLWRAPGKAETSMLDSLLRLMPILRCFGRATTRALGIADAIERSHPRDFDFWYLHYAGVSPEHQGKGWGGAAIRSGIERANAEGKPVWLETATESNVGLYRSLGFEVRSEWDAPDGGPHFWSMLRPAG